MDRPLTAVCDFLSLRGFREDRFYRRCQNSYGNGSLEERVSNLRMLKFKDAIRLTEGALCALSLLHRPLVLARRRRKWMIMNLRHFEALWENGMGLLVGLNSFDRS